MASLQRPVSDLAGPASSSSMEFERSAREAEAIGINPTEREKLNQYLRQLSQEAGYYLCLPGNAH